MMAEDLLVFGVEEIIKRLISLGVEEISLVHGVKKEVEKLQRVLTMIQGVLQDAEKKQVGEKALKLWLKELKQLGYDAEDVLDEIAYEDLRRNIEAQKRMKVRDFFSSSNPLALRSKIAHKIKDINQKLDDIAKTRDKFQLTHAEPNENVNLASMVDRETSSFVDDSLVVGRENDKSNIIKMLFESSSKQESLSVIPIVGLGGLGKTTLAQLVYNDEDVKKHFDLKIWICVSDDFAIARLLALILEHISNSKCELSSMDVMQKKLQKELSGKMFLLILDDVWNEDPDKWDALMLSLRCDHAAGSKIVVTTRSNNVASIVRTLPAYHLQILPDDVCRVLFERRAFKPGGPEKTSTLKQIGSEIVKKCGGVPLAVKVLGGLMYSKKEEHEWQAVCNSEIWNLSDGENRVMEVLKLSYNNLPPEVKQCFSYCALYPKDYEIEKKTLIQLWMAQGFLKPFHEDELMEDIGNEYFNILYSKSFLQDGEHKDGAHYKMHDIIHDLACSITKYEFQLVEADDNDRDNPQEDLSECRHVLLSSKQIISTIPKVLHKAKKLRTIFSDILSKDLDIGLIGSEYFPDISLSKSLDWRTLRVLDLSKIGIRKLPFSIGKLKHLRYLDLSFTFIQILPESITCLYNLQTLKIIPGRYFKELPHDLRNLINLRHLCVDLEQVKLPGEIGRLRFLQTLPVFKVGTADSGCTIAELGNLNFIQGKLTLCQLENVKDKMSANTANLNEKKRLHTLTLRWTSEEYLEEDAKHHDNDISILEGLQPHSNLRNLCIKNFGGIKFPRWVTSGLVLANLLKISLYDCDECEHIPSFGELPSLMILDISSMRRAKFMGGGWNECNSSSATMQEEEEEEDEEATEVAAKGSGRSGVKPTVAYPSLEKLNLYSIPHLEEWFELHAFVNFPCLKSLSLAQCPKLKKIPLVFPALEALSVSRGVRGATMRLIANNLTTLTFLHIEDIEDLTFLSEGLLRKNNLLSNLTIMDCPKFQAFLPEDDDGDDDYEDHVNNEDGDQGAERRPRIVLSSSLRELKIHGCSALKSMPNISGLTSLQKLTISGCEELKMIPAAFFYSLLSLEELSIEHCPKLNIGGNPFPSLRDNDVAVESQFTNKLSSLTYLQFHDSLEFIGFPPDFLQTNTQLQTVSIYNCAKFQGFHASIMPEHQLVHPSLEMLTIYECPGISSVNLEGMLYLRKLTIIKCRGLKSLEGLECLTALHKLRIGPFSEELDYFPLAVGKNCLKSLQYLEIEGWPSLKCLPYQLQYLTQLVKLSIHRFDGLVTLPEWLGKVSSLEDLSIYDCKNLMHLPSEKAMRQLTSLRRLYILNSPLLLRGDDEEKRKVSHLPYYMFSTDPLY